MESKTRHSVITAGEVPWKVNVGIENLKDMLIVKTKKGIIHVVHPLHHIYIVDNIQLNRKCLNAQFYTEYLLHKNKSLEGNMGAWIYTTGNFTVAYPCTKIS